MKPTTAEERAAWLKMLDDNERLIADVERLEAERDTSLEIQNNLAKNMRDMRASRDTLQAQLETARGLLKKAMPILGGYQPRLAVVFTAFLATKEEA